MKIRSLAALAATLAGGLVALATAGAPSALAKAEGWKIDPVHSFVQFRIKHLSMGYILARFDDVSGSVQFDEADPAACSVAIEVKASSVDTNNKKRDDDLRAPDVFNAAQFPTITFKSTSVKKADASHYEVTGDLTLHGTTKQVVVPMEMVGSGVDPWKKQRMGFAGEFTIQRSQWGMSGLAGAAGDDVRLSLAIESTKE